jgi:hypothetical protein
MIRYQGFTGAYVFVVRAISQGGGEKGREGARPAVKSRLKTGDFACERHSDERRCLEDRLAAIHSAPMSSWSEDESTWVVSAEEAELPAFDAPSAGASLLEGAVRQRYLYKDIISVVPSPEELEAMRRAHAEMAEGSPGSGTRGSASRHVSSRSVSCSASDTTASSDDSDSDGDP